ncbi:MAG TPA: fibronectin type III domain-containing protein, partial [Chromatiales bacterium]|nr:fibronectin type III domain-containing protein [Chromatiales bacterium]
PAPGNLTATATSSTQINLSWTDNASNEDGQTIQYSTDGGSSFSDLTSVSTNTTSFQNTGLNASTTYHYRLFSYNGSGNSAYSNSASATTQALGSTQNTNSSSNTVSATSGGGGGGFLSGWLLIAMLSISVLRQGEKHFKRNHSNI